MPVRRLAEICETLERKLPKCHSEIFSQFAIPDNYPWSEKLTDDSNVYACLYGLAAAWKPKRILEIGTGYGLGTMALMLAGSPLDQLVTVDKGKFQGLRNIDLARSVIQRHPLGNRCQFFRANTQPGWILERKVRRGQTSRRGKTTRKPHPSWRDVPKLVAQCKRGFDLAFIDGEHTGKALLNDLRSFWPYLRKNGLVICDDIHDPARYPHRHRWIPDTWNCFHKFLRKIGSGCSEYHIWDYAFTPSGRRPIGLIWKAK